MNAPMLIILKLKQRMSMESPLVLKFFIGDDDQRLICGRRPFFREKVEMFPKRSLNGVSFEGRFSVDLITDVFLAGGHGAGSAGNGVAYPKDELSLGGNGDPHIVGEKLGSIKVYKAIKTDRFRWIGLGPKL